MSTKSRREGYLAALLDGEGTVAKAPEKSAVIYSSDPDLIYAGAYCAVCLGFTALRLSGCKRDKQMWMLCFYQRDSFERLLAIPLQSQMKIERLKLILASYKGRQKKQWDRDKALKLHKEGFTPWQIGKRCGVDYTTIQHFLKGVPNG